MYNESQPTYLPLVERIVVIGDVHGDISRLMECLYGLNIISRDMKWIAQPANTIVVQLGDQIDSMTRGGDPSWEVLPDIEVMLIMEQLDKIAKLGGGRVISLLGNHEIMNVIGDYSYVSPKSRETYDNDKRTKLLKPGNKLNEILAKRNIILKIGPYLFCHGGLLPRHLDLVNNNIHMLNDIVRNILNGNGSGNFMFTELFLALAIHETGILWTREYVALSHTDPDELNELITDVLNRTESKAIFVGHSTMPQITPLANTRVFLMDTGLSRAYGTQQYQVLEIRTNMENGEPTYNVMTVT